MVVAAEKYIHLTNLAVSAAMDPSRWQVFLDELSGVLGTRVCTQLIGYDQLTRAAPLTFSSGYDPDLLALYHGHYADKNPFAENFARCAVGATVATGDLCPPDQLLKTSFYADLLKPSEDIIAGGGAMLASDADRMFLIGGNMRARDQERHEADWLQLCLDLSPIIRQSLEISRTISGLAFEKWAAEQHMLGTGTALVVVDQALTIHYACCRAEKLLAGGRLVGSGLDRRLRFRSAEIQSEFATFCRFQARDAQQVFRNWRIFDDAGKAWNCRSIGLRLADLDSSPFGTIMPGLASGILLAFRSDTDRSSFRDRVQGALGLSQAEAAAVLKLADGLTPAEIASDRDVSVHTVRNQIKAALSKTGCRRQSDLVRRVEHLRLRGDCQV